MSTVDMIDHIHPYYIKYCHCTQLPDHSNYGSRDFNLWL